MKKGRIVRFLLSRRWSDTRSPGIGPHSHTHTHIYILGGKKGRFYIHRIHTMAQYAFDVFFVRWPSLGTEGSSGLSASQLSVPSVSQSPCDRLYRVKRILNGLDIGLYPLFPSTTGSNHLILDFRLLFHWTSFIKYRKSHGAAHNLASCIYTHTHIEGTLLLWGFASFFPPPPPPPPELSSLSDSLLLSIMLSVSLQLGKWEFRSVGGVWVNRVLKLSLAEAPAWSP